jgi:hypothetical protein
MSAQLERALEILDPPAKHRAACIDDIKAIIRRIQTASVQIIDSKDTKRKAASYCRALRRVQKTHAKIDPTLQFALLAMTYSPVGGEGSPFYTGTPFSGGGKLISQEIANVELFLKPLPHGRQDTYIKKAAVAQAYGLLVRWGHVPTKTRGKPWDQLSGVLSGKAGGFLQHMCALQIGPD